MNAAGAIDRDGLEAAALVPAEAFGPTFYLWHLMLPLLFAMALLALLELAGGNRWIADRIFAFGGGHWSLQHHVITSRWIHPGGKYLSLLLWVAALMLWWRSRREPGLQTLSSALAYLLIATLAATCLVSALKMLTQMDCPWDLQAYGGRHPFVGLFDQRPAGLRASGCFPSGHASAGYAWLALYFFLADVAPRWRWSGLLLGLGLGAVFGISQQLRGAHFASHDVASFLVCWLTALGLYAAGRGRRTLAT